MIALPGESEKDSSILRDVNLDGIEQRGASRLRSASFKIWMGRKRVRSSEGDSRPAVLLLNAGIPWAEPLEAY